MIRCLAFLPLALTALLGLQFADCLSPISADQETMQCCGSMPCNPTNQSHDCCKTMGSSQSTSVLPVAHITLHAPVTVSVDALPLLQILRLSERSHTDPAAPQHSPPDLYIVHASLLI